jgi:hypothetical protein
MNLLKSNFFVIRSIQSFPNVKILYSSSDTSKWNTNLNYGPLDIYLIPNESPLKLYFTNYKDVVRTICGGNINNNYNTIINDNSITCNISDALQIKFYFDISGVYKFCCGSRWISTNNTINIKVDNNIIFENNFQSSIVGIASSYCPTDSNLQNNFSKTLLINKPLDNLVVNFSATNTNSDCGKRTDILLNVTVTAELTLDIQKLCTQNINHPFCFQYFTDNPIDGLLPSSLACFTPSTYLSSPFFQGSLTGPTGAQTGSICYPLVTSLFSLLPQQSSLAYDQLFSNLCSSLNVNASNYKNFTNGSNPVLDERIKQVCSCHLPLTTYDKFYNSVTANLEFLTSINLGTKQCIFPDCAASIFRSSSVVGNNLCPGITCLNVTNINNDGTYTDGLSITQSNECSQLFREKLPCTTSSDCPTNRRYDCIAGKCSPKVCNVDSDCLSNQRCVETVCMDYQCTSNDQCNSNQYCNNNMCIDKSICFKDSDCPKDFICERLTCTPKPNTLPFIIGASVGAGVLVVIIIIIILWLVKRR